MMLKKLSSPLKVTADSYCLYNSFSRLTLRNESMSPKFRLKRTKVLIPNRNTYDTIEYQRYVSLGNFEDEVSNTLKKGSYSGMCHLVAMARVLNISGNTIYPKIIDPCLHPIFLLKLIPTNKNKKLYFKTMWAYTSNFALTGWETSHFVPCVMKPLNEEKY